MRRVSLLTLLLALLMTSTPALGKKFDKLAQTPPMGWNSWNRFGCNIDERIVRKAARAMVSSGMKAAVAGSVHRELRSGFRRQAPRARSGWR